LVHNSDVIGASFKLSGSPTYLRQPSTANVIYPACATVPGTSISDKHYNGQLLGRIWWDILTNGTSVDPLATARLLFTDWTMLSNGEASPHDDCNTVGQPADTGTLIEVLTADDDDLDISNGTPNDAVICQAFADRSIETQFALSPCLAPLRGGGTCRADMNYDGLLDILDFLEFQNSFAAAHPFADFTGDGILDFFDFLAFENEFAVGCR
jgi:hypothetical protein